MLMAGCSNRAEPEVPEVPDPSASQSSSGTPGDPTPSSSSTVGVPETCGELISFSDVLTIVQAPLPGDNSRVYNDDFLADSGRTGRLTCTYGIAPVPTGVVPPPTPAPPPLEIAVSAYTDPEIASGRISSTVDSVRANGGQAAPQAIGGRDGFVLTDTEDVSFVVADDVRTYVITLRHGVVPAAAEPVVLLDLARAVLGDAAPTAAPPT